MSGCVKTEVVVRTQEVAVLPPPYLYVQQPKPSVPESIAPDKRTGYLLEGYASRGDALEKANARFELIEAWVKQIKALYPDSVEKPLDDLEPEADDPK